MSNSRCSRGSGRFPKSALIVSPLTFGQLALLALFGSPWPGQSPQINWKTTSTAFKVVCSHSISLDEQKKSRNSFPLRVFLSFLGVD